MDVSMGVLRAFLDGLVAPCSILLAFVVVGWCVHALGGLSLRRIGGRGVQTVVFVALGIAATLVGGGKGVRRVPVPVQGTSGRLETSTEKKTEPCVARAFGIVRIALSNDSCWIETAWTNGSFQAGTLLDHLVKTNLEDAVWTWHGVETVGENVTNTVHGIGLDDFALSRPNRLFVCVVPRVPVSDLRDSDGDGLPDNYELHGGTNPWIKDADLAARTRLTSVVGLQGMLDQSAPYDVFEFEPGKYELSQSVTLPTHPVMLCAAEPYAVIRSPATPAVFLLTNGQTGQTLFQNLYVQLDARNGFQSAFWCGGNLPWSGASACASFRNVYVRMPRPGVECFGWHFYRWNVEAADFVGCTVNAAGATWANGVYGYDPPPIRLRGCSFLNFPTNRLSARSCGIYLETSSQNFGGVADTVPVTLSDTLFDASFTNALPLARIERGTNFLVSADRCIVPVGFLEGHGLDRAGRLWATNAGVAWCGVPLPGFPADTFGVGAHVVLTLGTQDSDGDGDADHVEVYQYGTDPWLVDSDGDGVDDAQERIEGTDPRDGTSFLRTLAVTVTNQTTELGVSTHVCWSTSPEIGVDRRGAATFTGHAFTTNYVGLTVSGPLYVKAFRDLDGDGTCSPVREPFIVRDAGYDHAMSRFSLAFGDVDGDLVADMDEWRQGTNPNDVGNFRLAFTLSVTNVDLAVGITNFLVFGMGPIDGTADVSFSGAKRDVSVSTVVSDGRLPVVCWRDLDRDGLYTPGIDTVFSNAYGCSARGRRQTFRIGDFDGDGIGDGVERLEQTDVFGKNSHCYNLSITYTDVFQTTNALTFEARFGTNTVWGPAVVTDGTWTHSFGHCVATNGERVSVSVWDDVNGNGRWDEGECSNRYDVAAVTSHDMHVAEPLAYRNFDRDRDNLPDWWEMKYGLPLDSNNECDDTDGDGLINLHEYWAGAVPTNRFDYGKGTFLRAICDGIDVRLAGLSNSYGRISKFLNYRVPHAGGYAGMYTINTNCWGKDIDTSCASMWNNFAWPGEFRKAGTLVSRRHVLFARHFPAETNKYLVFWGNDGNAYTNVIVATTDIPNTDIQVGLLASVMPDAVSVAKILPQNYHEYLKNLMRLPVLQLDYDENMLVFNIERPVDRYVYTVEPHETGKIPFYQNIVIGDSGNPGFLVVGNSVILLGCLHTGNYIVEKDVYRGGGIPFVTYYAREIQLAMDALCPGYSLDYFDLSSFKKLP